ncbi:hypothetical protein AJ80_00098 [Polytolypa hystricis UAMH7299]|uniref:Uncharacterized protein n=1 Tax=Polytolypa hystricis (strain UAMH7299) TaxID=1447883 RepID=A0A2B7Z502_POLH7|nr:hypothetical protein AJ80_00098 [Polytolypa hystricis UAMH7299]
MEFMVSHGAFFQGGPKAQASQSGLESLPKESPFSHEELLEWKIDRLALTMADLTVAQFWIDRGIDIHKDQKIEWDYVKLGRKASKESPGPSIYVDHWYISKTKVDIPDPHDRRKRVVVPHGKVN